MADRPDRSQPPLPPEGLPVGADSEVGPPADEGAVWDALHRWRAAGRRFALVTVVDSRGFTPRKPGAHMLLAADGEMVGTVGGGAIEQLALEQARALLPGGGTCVLRRHLTQELGMCCGGEMTLFIEVLEPAPRLVVFGAGYIAKPLAAMAADCGFQVTVVDGRPEWVAAERFPRATRVCRDPEYAVDALDLKPGDYAVVVTHDHALDQRLVQKLLEHPLKFLGMIGSLPKQKKFALRLRARGFSDEQIARLHTPLGLSIGARTPEEIAVSALAQLIAVRRGAPIEPGWVPPPGAGHAEEREPEAAGTREAPAHTEVERQ